MLSKSFKAGKCKTSLKLAVARIKLLKNKREVQVKQMRRDLAQLLETGQDQTARIRVEHVIREEKTMSAYDLIELYCELIVARLAIIESQKICPIDLKEAISSVIFASPRCADIPELLDVRKHFAAKYGKEFATSALELRPDCGVNRLIVEKLSAKAPDIETKTKVLTAIAQEHSIKWDPKAFEEQVQKPSEDLLNGPNAFTNKMSVESSTVQFSPSPAEKHKSVTKPTEKNMDRSSFGSNSFSPPVESASQPGPRAAASTYDVGESGHSYFREEVASSNRQKWAMEFKDATSAAQAAAESAERASMAARAAAELASRGHNPEYSYGSHEPSIYGSKHEAGNVMHSKLQGDSLARDSINRDHGIDKATYATKQRMQSGLEAERVQDHVARYSKSIYEDSETAQSQYSRVVSSSSVHSSSEKDATEANWQRKKIVKDNSSDEENGERHPIRPLSSHPSNRSHDGDAPVPVSNVQKSDSFTSESFFKADPVNEDLSERTDIADAGRGGIGRISSKSLSSHSSVSSSNHETIWDSPMHRNYVNQHSPFGAGEGIDQGGHRHGFIDDAPVVFDQSDPEDDDHPEIDKFIEKEDLGLTSKRPEANFLVSSSNMDYSAPDQQNGTFTVKDGSCSSMHSVSRLQVAEFSGIARGDNPLSQSDAVAYDVSDGASSDSEDQMIESTDRGDTVLSSLHNKKNVDTYEHPQSLSRSSLQDMEAMDKLDQFSSSFTDADAECHSSYARGSELNFGRLTGGLRNKGHLRPPSVKNPVVNEALQSETLSDDSSKKLMAFRKDRTARSVDVRKNVNNWKPHFKTDEDSRSRSQNSSDPDNFEDLGQHPSPGRREYCSVASPLSTSKLDSNLTIDNEEKVSSTFIKPENNEISQGKPHGRSVRRTSKESSRTSAASYIDEDTEKQCLSPAGRDTSSILSRQKPEDTKIAVPNTTRISGHADNYGKKSSVRSSKGSTSTATSFFDEENDEDVVLQPRDTGGNLGIRSGMRLSQRTRGSRVDQHNLKTADLESKSFESTSFMSETSLKSSTTGVKQEKDRTSKFFPPKLSMEEHPPHLSKTEVLVQKDDLSGHSVVETPFKPSVSSVKPSVSSVKPEKNKTSKYLPPNFSTERHPEMHSEAEILTPKDDPERSQRGSSHNNPSVSVSLQTGVPASNETVKPSTSRENSFKGSHVHPKLPDYETLADYFKSLRSNRR